MWAAATVGDPAVAVLGQPSAAAIKAATTTMGIPQAYPETTRRAAASEHISQGTPPTRHAQELTGGDRESDQGSAAPDATVPQREPPTP